MSLTYFNQIAKFITHNNKKFKQDSCVFSYYVIKLYLLLNLPLYFKTILDKHLKFIETEKSFKQLRELIDVSRNNLLLKQFIIIINTLSYL